MRSQVSGEVELKCLRLPGGLSGGCPDGVPNLPFYRLKEGLGVHEREKEKKKEKNRGEEGPGATSSFSDERVSLVR
jgi:hypothetical protein